jgi:hypothetical protein
MVLYIIYPYSCETPLRLITERILPLQNKNGIYVGYMCEIYENR